MIIDDKDLDHSTKLKHSLSLNKSKNEIIDVRAKNNTKIEEYIKNLFPFYNEEV
jgi:hypothetical protein